MGKHALAGTTLEVESTWLDIVHELDDYVAGLTHYRSNINILVADRTEDTAKLLIFGTRRGLYDLLRDELGLDDEMAVHHLATHVVVSALPIDNRPVVYVARHEATS